MVCTMHFAIRSIIVNQFSAAIPQSVSCNRSERRGGKQKYHRQRHREWQLARCIDYSPSQLSSIQTIVFVEKTRALGRVQTAVLYVLWVALYVLNGRRWLNYWIFYAKSRPGLAILDAAEAALRSFSNWAAECFAMRAYTFLPFKWAFNGFFVEKHKIISYNDENIVARMNGIINFGCVGVRIMTWKRRNGHLDDDGHVDNVENQCDRMRNAKLQSTSKAKI